MNPDCFASEDHVLTTYGVNAFAVYFHINAHGELTYAELESALKLSRRTITYAVKSLSESGLITVEVGVGRGNETKLAAKSSQESSQPRQSSQESSQRQEESSQQSSQPQESSQPQHDFEPESSQQSSQESSQQSPHTPLYITTSLESSSVGGRELDDGYKLDATLPSSTRRKTTVPSNLVDKLSSWHFEWANTNTKLNREQVVAATENFVLWHQEKGTESADWRSSWVRWMRKEKSEGAKLPSWYRPTQADHNRAKDENGKPRYVPA